MYGSVSKNGRKITSLHAYSFRRQKVARADEPSRGIIKFITHLVPWDLKDSKKKNSI